MYAVYHGPEGLKRIALRVASYTAILAEGLKSLGCKLIHNTYFDTIQVLTENRDAIVAAATKAGINVRLASADPEERRCWPTRAEEEKHLVPQQERREIVDPWFDRLALWLDSKVAFGETGLQVAEVDSFTSFELLTRGLNVPMDRIDGGRQMATRVGIVMHRLGWEKRRDGDGGRVWRYWRPGRKAAGRRCITMPTRVAICRPPSMRSMGTFKPRVSSSKLVKLSTSATCRPVSPKATFESSHSAKRSNHGSTISRRSCCGTRCFSSSARVGQQRRSSGSALARRTLMPALVAAATMASRFSVNTWMVSK
jgi:hypothetical protein